IMAGTSRPSALGERPVTAGLPTFAMSPMTVASWPRRNGAQGQPLPTVAPGNRRAEMLPLMMWFHKSTRAKFSRPLPFGFLARRSPKKRDAPVRHATSERKNLPSAPINPSIARKPAWLLDLAPGIYRHPGNRPDGKFPLGTRRGTFTVRFTVKLMGIPAIDLDRSRQTFAPGINALGRLFDRSR
ncbi:MAG: hypothetical protein U5L05_17050, partial [Rubrivivax sp.]|nr:hypothetical protein [Rubrivivax sp.]